MLLLIIIYYIQMEQWHNLNTSNVTVNPIGKLTYFNMYSYLNTSNVTVNLYGKFLLSK